MSVLDSVMRGSIQHCGRCGREMADGDTRIDVGVVAREIDPADSQRRLRTRSKTRRMCAACATEVMPQLLDLITHEPPR